MSQPSSDSIKGHFAQLAVQYYVAGRTAAIHQLIPVLGNLLHHAVEMALKSALGATMSLPELKALGHKLPMIWVRFKATFPNVNGLQFDSVVAELHRFEELRYPDSILAQGVLMELVLLREHLGTGPRSRSPTPRYTLVLEDVDELVEFIFATAELNPNAFTGAMTRTARDYLVRDNHHASKW